MGQNQEQNHKLCEVENQIAFLKTNLSLRFSFPSQYPSNNSNYIHVFLYLEILLIFWQSFAYLTNVYISHHRHVSTYASPKSHKFSHMFCLIARSMSVTLFLALVLFNSQHSFSPSIFVPWNHSPVSFHPMLWSKSSLAYQHGLSSGSGASPSHGVHCCPNRSS